MISLAGFLVIGLLVGTIAKALVPGREPGVGITILLGAVAQTAVWFGGRLSGLDPSVQPWSFFLSVGAAAVLLHLHRDTGLDDALSRREAHAAAVTDAHARARRPLNTPSLWKRVALTPAWAAGGALMLGFTGFVIGFFGPMKFQPWSNQGPMLGIFVTGPGGLLLGALVGGALRISRPEWPTRWSLWALSAANAAWGLFLLDLVVDSSWWH